jgi:hypothetical protein
MAFPHPTPSYPSSLNGRYHVKTLLAAEEAVNPGLFHMLCATMEPLMAVAVTTASARPGVRRPGAAAAVGGSTSGEAGVDADFAAVQVAGAGVGCRAAVEDDDCS